VERAEGNAFARRPRPWSPLTIFHLHRRKKRKGERVLSTSPRDSLPREALSRRHRHQAERISSRIVVPESSLPPQPLSRTTSPPDTIFILRPSLQLPSVPLVRATAPSPPCRIQMSLFSGPLRSPFTQPVRGYEERQRARKRLRGWLGGDGRIVGNVSGLDKRAPDPPTDTLARMSALVLSRVGYFRNPRLSATR